MTHHIDQNTTYPVEKARRVFRFDSFPEFLVLIGYICACLSSFFGWHFKGADSLFRYLTAVPILLSINWLKLDRDRIILLLFLGVALLARRLLVIWTLCAFAYQVGYLGIPVRKLGKLGVACISCILIVQLGGVMFGVYENKGYSFEKTGNLIYDLGTGNPNAIGGILFFYNLCWYVVLKNHHRLLFFITVSFISIVGYSICGSRTSLYGSIILMALAAALWIGAIRKWMRWLIAFLPVVLTFMTFWLAANIEDNEEINDVTSKRLLFVVRLTKEYDTREWIVGAPREDDDPLDNVYLALTMTGGLTLIVVYCAGFAVANICYFDKVKKYVPYMIALSAGGIGETYFAGPNSAAMIYWIVVMYPYFKYKPKLN